ncbi:MAG TPA: HmuY family protein [Pseudomonadota bacterium]|nr:HmuY family protein [Pseudomonadota bacterium]
MQTTPTPAARRKPSLALRLSPRALARFFALALAPLVGGCQGLASDAPDLSATADLSTASPDGAADLSAGPDLLPRCELPYDQRAINQVSTGAVTIAAQPGDPGTLVAEVDATAGGSANFGKNPFVYLDLIGGKKVEVTDVQAIASGAWDIAFKRWQIKLNGGDSGPGGVGAVLVPDKALSEVAAAPAGPYVTDSYFDAKCMLQLDSIDGLLTVLSDWYEYDGVTMQLAPKKQVIVLNRRDGKGHIKVQLTGYYKGMAGGNYALAWSLLP